MNAVRTPEFQRVLAEHIILTGTITVWIVMMIFGVVVPMLEEILRWEQS